MERIRRISRRTFLFGLLGAGGVAAAACSGRTERRADPPIVAGPEVDATEEDKAQAARILEINKSLADEFFNDSLRAKYQVNIGPVDMKYLTMFRKFPYAYQIPSNAIIGAYRNLSMVAVMDNRFSKDDRYLGSDIALFTPLMGEPLPEFSALGIKNDFIPSSSFIDAANLAFNLSPNIQWGNVYTVNAGNTKQAFLREGQYSMEDGRQVKVTVSSRGSIRLSVSNPLTP